MIVPELKSICTHIARRIPDWTQGAGGNVSIKDASVLYIKASGFRLDAVESRDGFVKLDREKFVKDFLAIQAGTADTEQKYARAVVESTMENSAGMRASMEAGFHACLPGRVVAHFHSLAAILMAQEATENPKLWAEFLGSEAQRNGGVAVVDCFMPGYELSLALTCHEHGKFLIVRNHGVVMQGASGEIVNQWAQFEASYLQHRSIVLKRSISQVMEADFFRTKLRYLMPDTAVFADRMRALGVENSLGEWEVSSKSSHSDQDALELWQATAILNLLSPSLSEVPESVSASISNTPLEVFRRQMGRGQR